MKVIKICYTAIYYNNIFQNTKDPMYLVGEKQLFSVTYGTSHILSIQSVFIHVRCGLVRSVKWGSITVE